MTKFFFILVLQVVLGNEVHQRSVHHILASSWDIRVGSKLISSDYQKALLKKMIWILLAYTYGKPTKFIIPFYCNFFLLNFFARLWYGKKHIYKNYIIICWKFPCMTRGTFEHRHRTSKLSSSIPVWPTPVLWTTLVNKLAVGE